MPKTAPQRLPPFACQDGAGPPITNDGTITDLRIGLAEPRIAAMTDRPSLVEIRRRRKNSSHRTGGAVCALTPNFLGEFRPVSF
jgi:hypothetical protein